MSVKVNGDTGVSLVQDNALLFTSKNNWIINGQFDVWQRGTSQTSSGYGSDDRWANYHNESSKTHSKQVFTVGQIDVPNNPTNFSRTVITTAGTASCYVVQQQTIEDVRKFAGKTVTISFWAKADASKNLSIEFQQAFGSGGSSTVTTLGIQKFALNTLWQRFTKTVALPSVAGKTIGDNSGLILAFWFDAGSSINARTDSLGNQSGTFDIANVCLVEGSVPVECPNEPYDSVLEKCDRYFQKIVGVYGIGTAANSTALQIPFKYRKQMRTTPWSFGWNSVRVSDGVADYSVSNAFLVVQRLDSCLLYVASSGLTQYRSYYFLNLTNDGYITIEAEL